MALHTDITLEVLVCKPALFTMQIVSTLSSTCVSFANDMPKETDVNEQERAKSNSPQAWCYRWKAAGVWWWQPERKCLILPHKQVVLPYICKHLHFLPYSYYVCLVCQVDMFAWPSQDAVPAGGSCDQLTMIWNMWLVRWGDLSSRAILCSCRKNSSSSLHCAVKG